MSLNRSSWLDCDSKRIRSASQRPGKSFRGVQEPLKIFNFSRTVMGQSLLTTKLSLRILRTHMACWRSPKDERAPFDGAKRVGLKVATGVEAAVASTRVDRSDASMRFCDVIKHRSLYVCRPPRLADVPRGPGHDNWKRGHWHGGLPVPQPPP